MTRIDKYKLNEKEIASTLMQYSGYKPDEYKINSSINDFEPVDLVIFKNNNKLSHIEIKCRESLKIGYMIEYKKLTYFLNKIKDEKEQCRYINYIESEDILIIFNINKRIKNVLKNVYANLGGLFKFDGYRKGAFQNNNNQKTYKDKYFLDLYFNPEYGDTAIYNFSDKLKLENIPFEYEKVK
ncbi:hypothetical protein SYJ56_07975 [Algoriphagus sp. D3-2-R+10]|uniref:hypothetical protein n=1 Tax=Algoriphagus aurantiacus TaxID=3103948 RepID=UPI002B3A6691|nr:hypothetical protein [Algoriphagus sp. D3-2-R+10]MEB2775242.1 hypothetical protein [Algoriphagus sp. D3-2-R+10]